MKESNLKVGGGEGKEEVKEGSTRRKIAYKRYMETFDRSNQVKKTEKAAECK